MLLNSQFFGFKGFGSEYREFTLNERPKKWTRIPKLLFVFSREFLKIGFPETESTINGEERERLGKTT